MLAENVPGNRGGHQDVRAQTEKAIAFMTKRQWIQLLLAIGLTVFALWKWGAEIFL
jgi:hypothetical protein